LKGIQIEGLEDDSTIYSVGSLSRRIDGQHWKANLVLHPKQDKRSLTLSQAPILSRRRVLNPTKQHRVAGYRSQFISPSTDNWKICRVDDCPALEGTRLARSESEQNCFCIKAESGPVVYLPQFELARALFFHDGYLSRTAMESGPLKAEFDVNVDRRVGTAHVNVMPSSGYPLKSLDNYAARRVLSWILIDQSARASYESISRYQMELAVEKNGRRYWNFRFDPPPLKEVIFTVRGKFDEDSNSIFVYEITAVRNLSHDVPPTVEFFHPNFKEYERGEGEGSGGYSGHRPSSHNVYDDSEANSDNNHVILNAPNVVFEFSQPFDTTKVYEKTGSGSKGRKNDDIEGEASDGVSTEEGSAAGELPRADWETVEDESDDAHLYVNKFDCFVLMLNQLESAHGCTIKSKKIQKLPVLPRCNKHILNTDGKPRCIAVIEVTYNDLQYLVLEVDTSDSAKSLSTKLLRLSEGSAWESEIEEIKKEVIKRSLAWPKNVLDRLYGDEGHKGIPHPRSMGDNKGMLKAECIDHWATRVSNWFNLISI